MKIQDDWWQEGYEVGASDKLSQILQMFENSTHPYAQWAYDFLMNEGEA